MPFLPNPTKPRRVAQQMAQIKKMSITNRIFIRLAFASFAAIACLAVLQYGLGPVLNPAVFLGQTQPKSNQNITPPALSAAANFWKAQGCTPLTTARLESQNLPPGIVREPAAPMAIALTGLCPKTEDKAVIAYQDKNGKVSLSDPLFKTISLLKLAKDGTIAATVMVRGQKTSPPITFKIAGSRLIPTN